MKHLTLFLFLFLTSSTALAVVDAPRPDGTALRITIDCAKYIERVDPTASSTDPITTDECEKARLYFDLGVQFAGVAINLDRPRGVLAGFNAGSGYGLRWCPDWWTWSDALLLIDLFVNFGVNTVEHVGTSLDIGLAGMVSIANIVGGGIGYQWRLGLGELADDEKPVALVGIVHSF